MNNPNINIGINPSTVPGQSPKTINLDVDKYSEWPEEITNVDDRIEWPNGPSNCIHTVTPEWVDYAIRMADIDSNMDIDSCFGPYDTISQNPHEYHEYQNQQLEKQRELRRIRDKRRRERRREIEAADETKRQRRREQERAYDIKKKERKHLMYEIYNGITNCQEAPQIQEDQQTNQVCEDSTQYSKDPEDSKDSVDSVDSKDSKDSKDPDDPDDPDDPKERRRAQDRERYRKRQRERGIEPKYDAARGSNRKKVKLG